MPSILTLQLIFDPTQTAYTPFGRFLPDPGPSKPVNQRSKVWILDSNAPVTDNPANPFTISISNNPPQVQIGIIGNLGNIGYTWGSGDTGYALRIAAVFGRSSHHGSRDQSYASAFPVPNATPKVVGTIFDMTFTASQITNNQAVLLPIGSPFFHDAGANSSDIYAFNVGVTAFINVPPLNTTSVYTFGHDPDLQVDQ